MNPQVVDEGSLPLGSLDAGVKSLYHLVERPIGQHTHQRNANRQHDAPGQARLGRLRHGVNRQTGQRQGQHQIRGIVPTVDQPQRAHGQAQQGYRRHIPSPAQPPPAGHQIQAQPDCQQRKGYHHQVRVQVAEQKGKEGELGNVPGHIGLAGNFFGNPESQRPRLKVFQVGQHSAAAPEVEGRKGSGVGGQPAPNTLDQLKHTVQVPDNRHEEAGHQPGSQRTTDNPLRVSRCASQVLGEVSAVFLISNHPRRTLPAAQGRPAGAPDSLRQVIHDGKGSGDGQGKEQGHRQIEGHRWNDA